jgi:hypothetical protein
VSVLPEKYFMHQKLKSTNHAPHKNKDHKHASLASQRRDYRGLALIVLYSLEKRD